jgi:GTP-binding protein YchF
VVEVPDPRLDSLSELFHPRKTIYATFEFTDIAGLVKGASKGEGLGNQFLANIRQTDAICEIVRCFDDPNITHVEDSVDPIRDIEIVELELMIADLEVVTNRMGRLEKKVQTKDKAAAAEFAVLKKAKEALEANIPVRTLQFSKEEEALLRSFQLLTAKPRIYVANISEDDIADPESNGYFRLVREYAAKEGSEALAISCKIEDELAKMEEEDRDMFRKDLGLEVSGLDRLITSAYHLLGLKTFFTAGEDECRAWTFKDGMLAPECAGIIHSDFERGFIRAETYSFEDIMTYKTEAALRSAGKMRSEGKEYVVKDGDVMHFLFNV